MSIFSGLNNLKDISMVNDYADICGVSEEEIRKYFDESVAVLGDARGLTKDECYLKLKDMYDGYHFSSGSVGVYNPFSLLNAFSDREFKDYDPEFQEYRLGFPNNEVKNGFLKFIYSYYVPVNPAEGNTTTAKLARALRDGKPDVFMQILESLFAGTTYQIQGNAEKNFQYAMYIIMELLGEYVQAERATSNGRIDLLLQTRDYIYIVELKIDSTADVAMQQIEEKGYAKPFVDDRRKLFRIGVSFSIRDRRIEDWKVLS